MNKPLFIFEMANNHSGDIEHGKKIIAAIKEKCTFDSFDYAFKLQYRHLDTFIHKDYRDSADKNVKRFLSTKLSDGQFLALKDEIVRQGFIPICTPFDEPSVELVIEHDYKYIKIASCSFTDWPLLEKIVQYDKPIIASVAGASQEEIDRVVEFFRNRNKSFSLMHCVGEYPTQPNNLQLNQIDLLMRRYPDIRVGYSAHEEPDKYAGVMIAVAKGASLFEKHVGVSSDSVALNAYSATPEQVGHWLAAAHDAYAMCGVAGRRHDISYKEKTDLWNLRRGVFARSSIKKGEHVSTDNIYLAIPKVEGQLIANSLSKYDEMATLCDIAPDKPVLLEELSIVNVQDIVREAYDKVKDILIASSVAIAPDSSFELSHHYGIEGFFACGAAIIECINRSYCKKVLVLLPGQKHPTHCHKQKEESFQVLYGSVDFTIDGETKAYKAGEIAHVLPGVPHSFSSTEGAVFEEVSTTHYVNDSFYEDEYINNNKRRKTKLTFWKGKL